MLGRSHILGMFGVVDLAHCSTDDCEELVWLVPLVSYLDYTTRIVSHLFLFFRWVMTS